MKSAMIFSAALALSLSTPAHAAMGAEDPAVQARYASACNHYQNRARFKPRKAPYEYVTILAEACDAAQRSRVVGQQPERAAATRFLDRMATLRDTVVQMNIDRVYGKNPSPFAKPRDKYGVVGPIPKVSATGEYLIACSIGVIDAYDAWIDSGTDFSLAWH